MIWIRTILILIFQFLLTAADVKINNWLWWPISICFILYGTTYTFDKE